MLARHRAGRLSLVMTERLRQAMALGALSLLRVASAGLYTLVAKKVPSLAETNASEGLTSELSACYAPVLISMPTFVLNSSQAM